MNLLKSHVTLRQVLQRSVFMVAAFFLFVTFLVSGYLASNISKRSESQRQNIAHKTLHELIRSSMQISDYMEIQRVLGLVTQGNEVFGVVSASGNLVLSDYSYRPLFESIAGHGVGFNCRNIEVTDKQHNRWSVHCTSLADGQAGIVLNDSTIPVDSLVSLKKENGSLLAVHDFVVICLVLAFALLIAILFLRQKILNAVLNPLEALVGSIGDLTERSDVLGDVLLAPNESETSEMSKLREAFNGLLTQLQCQFAQLRESDRTIALAQLAEQVSHDIRSPVAALNMVVAQLPKIEEEKRILVRAAVQRITDIANSLLNKDRNASFDGHQSAGISINKVDNCTLLSSVIDSLVSEKRVQITKDSELDIFLDPGSASTAFAKINSQVLKRVLSNLIDNSIEAVDGYKGTISLKLFEAERSVTILVEDNGRGIPGHILELLKTGRRGISHGKASSKKSGSGLGVHYARQEIESAGGSLEIESTEGQGTRILIQIPRLDAPKWFANEVLVSNSGSVVVLDDDPSIQSLWRGRFELDSNVASSKTSFKSFSSASEFERWMQDFDAEDADREKKLYLIDYELQTGDLSGLDLIERYHLASTAILVTSRFDETAVQERCLKLGLLLLPKFMVGFVPLS